MVRFNSFNIAVAALLVAGALAQPAVAGSERAIRYEQTRHDPAAQRHARFNLIKAVQQALSDAHYDPGPVDGRVGPRTAAAIRAYQRDKGLSVDGAIGAETLQSLGLSD